MYTYILEKSAVQREFSGILNQKCVYDWVTDPRIRRYCKAPRLSQNHTWKTLPEYLKQW